MERPIITDKKVLRGKSQKSPINENSKRIAQDLKDTLVHTWTKGPDYAGGAMAAPQINEFERIVVVAVKGKEAPESIKVLYNPEVIYKTGKQETWERCLSTLLEFDRVERPYAIKVKYQDENGKKKTVKAKDFWATCYCHEIDHLDGILCSDLSKETVLLDDPSQGPEIRKKLNLQEPSIVLDYGDATE